MSEIIFLGCGSVGKTLISRQIIHHLKSSKDKKGSQQSSLNQATMHLAPLNVVTTPTTGMQFESVRLDGTAEVKLREVGYDMARLWHKYYKKADALLYVIDASNRAQLALSSVELYRILENPSVAKKPLCILYNKIDQSLCMEIESIRQYVHVAELRQAHKAPVFDCPVSALKGWNFDVVVDILRRCLKR
eukprot:INCI3146.1.p1 GENE.INCI3146.1~~INCI3146.1.p1  ORF type:complete len:190 (+),score=33.44 INCI3146.1:360-929(+)